MPSVVAVVQWRLGPMSVTGTGKLSQNVGGAQAKELFNIVSNYQADFLLSYLLMSGPILYRRRTGE